nr:hypothetical protein BaRGS_020029 [Batillaria attramentaria]
MGTRARVLLQNAHSSVTRKDGSDENAGPDVVIMVLTMSKNMAARQAIRDTYGSVARGKAWPGTARQEEHSDPRNSRTGTARVVFLMGQTKDVLYKATEKETLAAESREYGDVVQWEGLVEDYSNLTLKVLLGLRWVRDMCPHAHHVVKTDDDTFIHLPRFFQHLRNPTDDLPDNVIRGAAFGTANVLREGKYSVSREAFPLDTYPPHVKGQIYSMPVPLAMRMLGVAEYVPYNRMEDVHTTGTLACVVGATHFGFTVREFNYCSHNCSACDFSDGVRLAARHVTPDNFREVWNAEIHPEACSAFTTTILKIASFLRPKTCYFFL